MPKYTILPITPSNGNYSLSDDTATITECPCCDLPLSLRAVTELINRIDQRWKGVSNLREMVEYHQRSALPKV